MATSYGTTIPGLVTLRVSRSGDHALVRIWIGQTGSAGLTGELRMTREDWRMFRALLPEYAPQRMSIYYADGGVFEWLTSAGGAG